MGDSNQNRSDKLTGSRNILIFGAIAAMLVAAGSIADIFIGTALGGDLNSIPQTAVGRFTQIHRNPLLGLYYFDLLNVVITLILIPAFYAIFFLHLKNNQPLAQLSMILFIIGTAVFVVNNSALTMLELSNKYFSASNDAERNLIASAGEAFLARGAHGSAAVFFGFILPIIADIILSFVMLQGKIFAKLNSYLGIIGNFLLLIYMILVTFVPGMKSMAMIIAAPGGLMIIAWLIMSAIKLFRLSALSK